MKLGWLDSKRLLSTPGSLGIREVSDVRQVVLLSDGFLGDAHENPKETLRFVADLAERCSRVDFQEVLPMITALTHESDDASVVVVELES
jgi:hypothetical protein